jgi:hypothetical protein
LARGGSFFLTGGYGVGASNNYVGQKYAQLGFDRVFLQPAYRYSKRWVDIGLACRFSRLTFSSGNIDLSLPEQEIKKIQAIDEKNQFFLADIGLMAGVDLGNVHVKYHLTRMLFNQADTYGFGRTSSSLVLSIDLHSVFRANKQKDKM